MKNPTTSTTDPTTIALEAIRAWASDHGFEEVDQDTTAEVCPGYDMLIDANGATIVLDGEGCVGLTDATGRRIDDYEADEVPSGTDWLAEFFG